MSRMECLRDQEIMDAVRCGRLSEELKAHARECAICSDAVEIATLFREDFEGGLDHARVPSAGLVWWRAEIRARQEKGRGRSHSLHGGGK